MRGYKSAITRLEMAYEKKHRTGNNANFDAA